MWQRSLTAPARGWEAGQAGVLPWRNAGPQGRIFATGFEQRHTALSAGEQHELKERQSALVMRDDEEDGAPPRSMVDLTAGTAVIPVPGDRRQAP
ncbi:DUF6191 domain-containing protein [Streptomyces sp. NPDC054813]